MMFTSGATAQLVKIFKAKFGRDISFEEAQYIGLRIAQFVYVKAQEGAKNGKNPEEKPREQTPKEEATNGHS